jgi:hypothetical protein
MKSGATFVIVVIVMCLLSCAPARAQTLVYSLSYSETMASSRARFANMSPNPGLRSEAENIATLRNTRKNEIYSISVADGKRSLLFSDEGMHLEIRPFGSVSGAAKAYTTGVWRERRTTPIPGFYSDDGIYELSLDGSNHFRKIADDQKQGRPVLNPQGTKAAMVSWGNDKFAVSIYAVPEWKLLAAWDFGKLAQTHCPDCSPSSYGWLADGNRLYVSLVVAGEEDDDEAKVNHPGTYILSGDGADLGAIPANIGTFQVAGYIHPNFIERQFQGQLPDGRYLFLDYGARQGKSPGQTEPFLVISANDSTPQKTFPLKFPIGGFISPSGKYLAYIESRTVPYYRSEPHLWVKNLETGEDKELASVPPPGPPSSPEPNQTILIIGWMN